MNKKSFLSSVSLDSNLKKILSSPHEKLTFGTELAVIFEVMNRIVF